MIIVAFLSGFFFSHPRDLYSDFVMKWDPNETIASHSGKTESKAVGTCVHFFHVEYLFLSSLS